MRRRVLGRAGHASPRCAASSWARWPPSASGIGGLVVTSGAGAQERDAGTTTTTTASNPNTYNLSALANALDVLVTDPSAAPLG